jgi:hypothetical protein
MTWTRHSSSAPREVHAPCGGQPPEIKDLGFRVWTRRSSSAPRRAVAPFGGHKSKIGCLRCWVSRVQDFSSISRCSKNSHLVKRFLSKLSVGHISPKAFPWPRGLKSSSLGRFRVWAGLGFCFFTLASRLEIIFFRSDIVSRAAASLPSLPSSLQTAHAV